MTGVQTCALPISNYANKAVNIENLSVLDAPRLKNKLNERRSKAYMESAPFYCFVKKQKRRNNFKDVASSQLNFINRFDLKFIIVRKGAKVPFYLNEKIKEIIVDSLSGDRFVLLN